MAVALDKFVGQLRESGLIPPAELDALLVEIPALRKADGEQLARELVKRKKLTAYQAQEVYGGRGKKLVLGNYVIQDKLGQGGMGMVLKAEHRRMERIVALKVMSKAAVESPEAVKRFHREVKAAAKLTHPNIVTAFDADEAGGTHFLVMEFVEGSDLSQLVKKNGPLAVEKALTCILQAARGLEFAHEHGIVHRDIKPANLLLDAKGHVKILDMGLARIESIGGDQAELTGTGQIMGTVDYMAPEQAMNTRKADARADIYSLGITLWYLLTGKCAYGGETVMEKLMAHQTAPIPLLAEFCPSASPALEAAFKKMVAKTPGERYQSMTDVLAALERCKSGGDVSPTINLPASEDAKLSDFLKGGAGVPPSGASSRPAVAIAPSVAPSTGAGLDVTIVTNTPQADTDPQTQTSLHAPSAPLGAKPLYADPRVLAIGGGALGVMLLAGLISWLTSGPAPNPVPPIKVVGDDHPPKPAASDGLAFDGVSSHILLPSLPAPYGPPLTIEAIVTPRRAAQSAIISISPEHRAGTLFTYGGKWVARGHVAAAESYSESSAAFEDAHVGQRLHLAAIWQAGSATLYVNGRRAPLRANPKAAEPNQIKQVMIGGALDPAGKPTWIFDGVIHQVRYSTVPRYASDFAPPPRMTLDESTLALYNFDDGTGDVLRDASPHKHDGKIVGAKWGPLGGSPPPAASPAGGWALDFSEVADEGAARVDVPGGIFADQAYTLEMYLTPRRVTRQQKQSLLDSSQFHLKAAGPDFTWVAVPANGSAKLVEVRAENSLVANRRLHLAAIYTAQELRLFLDGKLVGKTPILSQPAAQSSLTIGGSSHRLKPGWGPFDGTIDQFRASRGVRYQQDFAPAARLTPDAKTLACYDFQEGSGTTLRDSSGNSRHGKIVGAKWVKADAASSDGFVPLFNGENLAGWKNAGANWRVEQGLLVGSGQAAVTQGGSLLLSERGDYTDFRLRVEARVGGGTSAGVGGRMQAAPNGLPLGHGYVAKINADSGVDPRKTGSLYVLDADGYADGNQVSPSPVPADEWLRLEMTVEGDRVLVEVNGKPTTDYRDPKRRFAKGHVALQLHSGDTRVEFRKIEIQELKPAAVMPPAAGPTPAFALEFNGRDNYVDLPATFQQDWTKPFAVEAVVEPLPGKVLVGDDKILHSDPVFRHYNADQSGFGLHYDRPNGTWFVIHRPNPKEQPTFYFARGDFLGKRQHVAVVFTGTECRIYVDGKRQVVQKYQQDAPFAAENPRALVSSLGDDIFFPKNAPRFFHGRMSYLRVSKNARFDADFKPNTQVTHDAHTVVVYRFAEGKGDVLNNTTGNQRDGKIVGAKWVTIDGQAVASLPPATPPVAPPPAAGDFALRFDGLDDFVELPPWPELPPGTTVTIEAWATLERRLMTRGGRSVFQLGPLHMGAGRGPEGNVRWVAALVGPNKVEPIVGGSVAVPLERAHLAIVVNDRGVVEYVNGREEGRKGFAGLAMPAKMLWEQFFKRPMTIGGGTAPDGKRANFFPGTIDELRISKTQRYNANFTPEPQLALDGDTLALYRFAEGTGDVLGDASPNQRHGKIFGAIWVNRGQAPPPALADAAEPAAAPFDEVEAKEHQAAWAKQLKVEVETPNSVGMKMVVIPPGQFMMGRSPRDGEVLPGEKLPDDDLPRHSVTLTKPFAIAATEVTQKQWKGVMNSTPWAGQKQVVEDPDRPATYVSWKGAVEFCKRLSEKEKAVYRLPTEAEWEWACRAGTETTFNFGDDAKELYDHAWARFNSQDQPHPVAQKNSNEWGLYDMHGNAWEWTADFYGPYSAEAALDPLGPATGKERTLRGGCFWSVPISDYRSSARRKWPEGLGYSESGFRPVLTLPDPTQRVQPIGPQNLPGGVF